jgi:hypothetical protein
MLATDLEIFIDMTENWMRHGSFMEMGD